MRLPLHRVVKMLEKIVPSQVKDQGRHLVMYLAGKPGGGKTQMLEWLAKNNSWGFAMRNMGLSRMEELGGIPELIKVDVNGVEEIHTKWSVPELVSELRNKATKSDVVLCLLDDWHLAGTSTQPLGYELFSSHSLKGYDVPKNVVFVLAGNETSLAGAKTQFSAILNRVIKAPIEASFDYWRDNYAYTQGVNDSIIAFLNKKENRRFFHEEEDRMSPWGSPRSWTGLSSTLDSLKAANFNINAAEMTILCSSHVGQKAGSEFSTFHNIYHSFNTEQIFKTGSFKIPTDAAERYAFVTAVSSELFNLIDNAEEDSDAKIKFDVNNKKYIKTYASIITAVYADYKELAMVGLNSILKKSKKLLQASFSCGFFDAEIMKAVMRDSKKLAGN